MQPRKTTALIGMLLTAHFAFADASYQTTEQITGGQFVDMVKNQAFIAREANKMFAPTNRIVMVHGNQKATISKDTIDIVDLDKGEMIHIDNVRKTYSIVTFEQMRKAFTTVQKQPAAPVAPPQPQAQTPSFDMKFDTSVNNTGVTKMIDGFQAQEQIITVKMTMSLPPGTDPTTGQAAAPGAQAVAPGAQAGAQPASMTYTVTTDCWITPDPPEVKEIKDFDTRMAQKMMEGVDTKEIVEAMKANVARSNAAMGQMFGGHPGSAQAMEQMGKEMAKIKGTRILEVTSMGGDAPAPAASPAGAPAQAQAQPAQPPQQGTVAGQVATNTATQTASGESGRLGIVGSSLTNSVIGAFHRKKQQPAQQPAAQQPQAQQQPAPAGAGAAPATQHVTLMEMTNSMSNFSEEPIPASAFQIPAGYKQVQTPMM